MYYVTYLLFYYFPRSPNLAVAATPKAAAVATAYIMQHVGFNYTKSRERFESFKFKMETIVNVKKIFKNLKM